MTNELVIPEKKNENIQSLIYNIRGMEVMLDNDLARLYGYEVKYLNRQVKRNINRFPDDFMFQLTRDEAEYLVKCQFGTSRDFFSGQGGGIRKLPFVFTEQGVYMLATVLRGEVAEQQSVQIMRAFREMRRFIVGNMRLIQKMDEIEERQIKYQIETNKKLDELFAYVDENEPKHKIFFSGEFYDAFSFLAKIIEKAKKEIILIDNYLGFNTFNILAKKRRGVKIRIFTTSDNSHNGFLSAEIVTFERQYGELAIQYTDLFHDRFLIVDEKTTYHIGTSINSVGKKIFGVDLIEDGDITKSILEKLEK